LLISFVCGDNNYFASSEANGHQNHSIIECMPFNKILSAVFVLTTANYASSENGGLYIQANQIVIRHCLKLHVPREAIFA